jgi:hypothetical protein
LLVFFADSAEIIKLHLNSVAQGTFVMLSPRLVFIGQSVFVDCIVHLHSLDFVDFALQFAKMLFSFIFSGEIL